MALRLRPLLVVDASVKATLIGLLLLAVIRPDLPQFEGKAMTGRAIGYPIAALLVPFVWWLRRRDLYDSIAWWDANHFANWAILREFMEYVTFIRNSPELKSAYTDTLGDLALGLSGSVVAAASTAALYRRRQQAA